MRPKAQRDIVADVGDCPDCGKRRYRNRKVAKAMARKLHPGHHLGEYECGDYWHIGHTPRQAIKGAVSRRRAVEHNAERKARYGP